MTLKEILSKNNVVLKIVDDRRDDFEVLSFAFLSDTPKVFLKKLFSEDFDTDTLSEFYDTLPKVTFPFSQKQMVFWDEYKSSVLVGRIKTEYDYDVEPLLKELLRKNAKLCELAREKEVALLFSFRKLVKAESEEETERPPFEKLEFIDEGIENVKTAPPEELLYYLSLSTLAEIFRVIIEEEFKVIVKRSIDVQRTLTNYPRTKSLDYTPPSSTEIARLLDATLLADWESDPKMRELVQRFIEKKSRTKNVYVAFKPKTIYHQMLIDVIQKLVNEFCPKSSQIDYIRIYLKPSSKSPAIAEGSINGSTYKVLSLGRREVEKTCRITPAEFRKMFIRDRRKPPVIEEISGQMFEIVRSGKTFEDRRYGLLIKLEDKGFLFSEENPQKVKLLDFITFRIHPIFSRTERYILDNIAKLRKIKEIVSNNSEIPTVLALRNYVVGLDKPRTVPVRNLAQLIGLGYYLSTGHIQRVKERLHRYFEYLRQSGDLEEYKFYEESVELTPASLRSSAV